MTLSRKLINALSYKQNVDSMARKADISVKQIMAEEGVTETMVQEFRDRLNLSPGNILGTSGETSPVKSVDPPVDNG